MTQNKVTNAEIVEKLYKFSGDIQIFDVPSQVEKFEVEIVIPASSLDLCQQKMNHYGGKKISATLTIPNKYRKLFLRVGNTNTSNDILPCSK